MTVTAEEGVNVCYLFISCQACGCVCWSPSSRRGSSRVAAGYSDGTLRIFRLASSEMEMKLHPHRAAVTAIQYSANGEQRQHVQTNCVPQLDSVTSFDPPAGHVILSAGKNGLVAVSSAANGETTRYIRDHKGAPITTIQCVNEQVSSLSDQEGRLQNSWTWRQSVDSSSSESLRGRVYSNGLQNIHLWLDR